MNNDIIEFLEQSNFIEGVYDNDSLTQSMYAWEYLIFQKKLDLTVILKTHKILMLHQPLLPDEKGYLRKIDVMVGGQIRGKYTDIPRKLDFWIKEMMHSIPEIKDRGIVPDLIEALNRKLHVQYEMIHPFVDGNGRTGRMFMNWWRVQCNLPIMVIREEDRRSYYTWFK